ncbi:MAG: hypothetical protein QOE62_3510, partial [Actinomycetota bacterium]|nr:hypothetical protein [Actinomycetota bacterium]
MSDADELNDPDDVRRVDGGTVSGAVDDHDRNR